jgi:hypothetical protein
LLFFLFWWQHLRLFYLFSLTSSFFNHLFFDILQASHKASAEQHASLLTSSLEETKAELCAVKSTFAEQEEASRLQLSIATTAAADLSLQLEEKLTAIQKLEEKLHSVVSQKERAARFLLSLSTSY